MAELSQADFENVRRWAPLVAMDLIVQDRRGRILLGKRLNEPAKGQWFVPGGRIRKDEGLKDAFARIVAGELGKEGRLRVSSDLEDSVFMGVFEHHYPKGNEDSNASTIHYVVLGYRIVSETDDVEELPTSQHEKWRWFSVDDLIRDASVHQNVKEYFKQPLIHREQYSVLADHRVNLNEMLWQTPVLSLTAQAFLFMIAFDQNTGVEYRVASIVFVVLMALASLQLIAKHRACETHCMKLLGEFESKTPGFGPVHDYKKAGARFSIFTRRSSYRLWIGLLWLFVGAGLWAGYLCFRDWRAMSIGGSSGNDKAPAVSQPCTGAT